MSEYIKRDDAVKTLEHLLFETAVNNCGIDDDYAKVCEDIATNRVDGYVSAVPDADVVEVVRCKECKYAAMTWDGLCKYCEMLSPDEKVYFEGDFYCAYGERRTDND